jgi:hypothetical protein
MQQQQQQQQQQATTATTAATRTLETRRMATTTSEEVIPREVLFGNPEYAGPSLSPDGKYLAYLRPHEGVLNAFVRTIGKNDDRVVTSDKLRGIRGVSWAQDSKTLLFNQDDGGDENFHLYGIDATTPGAAAVDLTPYPGCKAQNVVTNKRFPDELLVAVNNRNPAAFDMYRVNLPTALAGDVEGATTLDTENPGDVVGWGTEDSSFEVREAMVVNQADSSTTVRVRDSKKSEWRDLVTFPYGEEGRLVEFGADGKTALLLSTLERETTALLKIDLATGETQEIIAADDKCNVGGVLLDDDTKEVRAVSFNYARVEREFFDKDLEAGKWGCVGVALSERVS